MQISKSQLLTRIFLVLGILVLINILASEYHFRLDFTADQRYTLSNATKQILKDVERPVTVNAYFSKNLSSREAQSKRYFKDLLTEYRSHAQNNFVYNFINPNKNKKSEQKARRKGIRPMVLDEEQRDEYKVKRIYMGAVVKIGNKSEVISHIRPGGPVEYKLSSAVRKLSEKDKPNVALFQGQGEVSKKDLGRALEDLKVLYNVEEYTLKAGEKIPDKYRTGMIINPSDSFSPGVLAQLDEFLANGKNLLVATDRVNFDNRQSRLTLQNTGMESWLSNKGIEIKPNAVIDVNARTVMIPNRGIRRVYYFPNIKNFKEHPVTSGIAQMVLQFASEVNTKPKSNVKFSVLAETSKRSGTKNLPVTLRLRGWSKQDFTASNIPVAVSASGNFGGNMESRMVVFGSDNLISKANRNQRGRRNQVSKPNADFLVNAVDWLSDQMGLMELRTQGVSSRPLEEVSSGKVTTLKYGNAFGPILLIVIIGIIRNRIQQAKRKRWMAM